MDPEVQSVLNWMGVQRGETIPADFVGGIESALQWMRQWRVISNEKPPTNEYVLISVDGCVPCSVLAYCDLKGTWYKAENNIPFPHPEYIQYWRPL